MLSFGKKRKVTRSRKSTKVVKPKIAYTIKRTKSGTRVVQVLIIKKGSKTRKVYKSTRRAISKSAKVYRTKTMAKTALKKKSWKKRKLSNLITYLLPFIDNLRVEKFADKSLIFALQEIYAQNLYLPGESTRLP